MHSYTYSVQELNKINNFKCAQKALFANKRFEDKITYRDVFHLLQRFDFKCYYCGDPLHYPTWQLDHFYSRAMGGKNKIDNLAPACKWCNQMKNALDGNAFIQKCKKIHTLHITNNK